MINNTSSRNKRALLIGVNKYPNLPDFSQLRGCVNDVAAMTNTLETSFHFPPDNITILCDEQATAKGIRDAMERLVRDCGPDDIVVFHYSGHGSQMPALGDKPRGYDESIMPYDSGRMNPAFPKQVKPCDIRDTEIQEWLSRLTRKTSNVTLIFDSCHSGSITRMQDDADEGTRLRWIEPDPLPLDSRAACNNPDFKGEPVGASGWLVASDKYVLLAACAAEQGAYELDAPNAAGEETAVRHGAFTYFLTQEINHATENTYQDVWDMVAVKVNNRFQKQTPQLEGARNRRIFNVDDFTPMSYLLVTERRADKVVLAGGMVHGVTVGSRWAVYSPGTKHAGDDRLGELEIRSVTSTSATAVVVEEKDAIVPGARAIDAVHVDPEARMSVYIAPAPKGHDRAISRLRRCLEQSSLLTTAKGKKNARVVISVDRNGAEGESGWLVRDQSQSQLMDQCRVDDPAAGLRIRENLETIWRYQKVLELRNESSSLKGKVGFELRRRNVDGTWEAVDEDAVFTDGESIAFRVINRAGIPIHVSVLDLGLSKRIGLLHPPASASEMLAAGRSTGGATDIETTGVLIVGERSDDEIGLSFPENVGFLKYSSNGNSNGHSHTTGDLRGKETFKLCVTTDRHDLGFLKQSGIRMDKAPTPRPGLEELIYSAMGESTREAARKHGPYDDWLTIERSFWLKK